MNAMCHRKPYIKCLKSGTLSKRLADAKLISIVKEYEVLYNVNVMDYHNQLVRDNVWEEIGQKLGAKGRDCKRRWSILRDLYTKSRKKRKLDSEQGREPVKPWKYEFEMEFLKPFLGCRKFVLESNSCMDDNEETLNHNPDTPPPDENSPCSNMEIPNPEHVSSPSLPSNSPHSHSHSSSPSPSPSLTSKRAFKRPQLSRYSMNPPECSRRPTQSHDILTKYFEAVIETIRGFSPALQVKVKSEISTIVHQAEMEQIQSSEYEPYMQTGHDLPHSMQYSQETHPQYPFECALTKQEQVE